MRFTLCAALFVVAAAVSGCGGEVTGNNGTVQSAEYCASNCCYGPTCNNLDPYQQHCDVTSVRSIYVNCSGTCSGSAAVLKNVYSAGCNANWTVLEYGNPAGRPFLIDIDTSYYIGSRRVRSHLCYPENCSSYYTGTGYPMWTNMVDGQNLATACAHTNNGDGWTQDCVSQ